MIADTDSTVASISCTEHGWLRRLARPAFCGVALALAVLPLIACSGDGDGSGSRRPDGRPVSGLGASGGASGAGGTGAAALGNSGVPTVGVGAGGPAAGAPAATDGECGAVTQMAENTLQPADIIIGIDTSGSMAEEVAEVNANLNAFSQQIIDSGIDVRVIMLASSQERAALSLGTMVTGPCIAPPLGSGQCPDDSNPPTYVHIDQPVASWDVLDVYVNAYPAYKEHLREDSLKTFVSISDDNADGTTHPLGALFPELQPAIHTADDFIAAVDNLEPGSAMWSSWRYSGIYSFTLCPSAELGAIGVVHEELVQRTGGVAGDLCLQQFAPVFDELAQQVVASVTLACDWEIPPPPQGEAFDSGKTNVELTLDGAVEQLLKIPDASTCASLEGWHYDDETDPKRVVACPSTCTRIQAATEASVDLLFGCETVTVSVD